MDTDSGLGCMVDLVVSAVVVEKWFGSRAGLLLFQS